MEPAATANPLQLVARITVVLVILDALQVATHHTMSFVGYTRVVLCLAFLILYALRYRFAWHVAVGAGPLILAVYLFLYFSGGQIYRPPPNHARQDMIMWAVGEAILLPVGLIYLFRLRQPYFLYVSSSQSESI